MLDNGYGELYFILCLVTAQGVGVSIARGTGRQTLGAAIIFISYYIFALPIGVPLMFATYLGLAGTVYLNCREYR